MKRIKTFTMTLLVLGLGFETMGQQINLEPATQDHDLLGFRASLPMYKDNEFEEYSSLSGSYSIYTLINLKNDWSLYGEIPIIVAKYKSSFGDSESESGLGNIMVILRKSLNESKTSQISFGAFVPTAGKDNYLKLDVGSSANLYRIAQSIPAFTIYGNYSYSSPQDRTGIFGFEAGPEVWIPTDESDNEFLLHVGGKAGHKFSKIWLWIEYNGLILLSESDIDFNDRLLHQLVLGGQLNVGKVNPGVFYSLPLKDYIKDVQSGVLGFKVELGI